MKNLYVLLLIIFLLIVSTGCEKKHHLDLEDLCEKNGELAKEHFYGWNLDSSKYELIIFEPKNANKLEISLFSRFFSEEVEKILYIIYESADITPYVVAIQYKSVEFAQQNFALGYKTCIRRENIIACKEIASYLLLYGDYKEIDGYWLSLDGEYLLFDTQWEQRVDMHIPESVKYIIPYTLRSVSVKYIKCNKNLKILYGWSCVFFHSLEKIELNDGLKEIGAQCFYYHNLEYIVIPESVEIIQAEAFQNVTIYCNVEKIPYGWDKDFALNNCKVYWKGTWEYVDGVPKPILNEG